MTADIFLQPIGSTGLEEHFWDPEKGTSSTEDRLTGFPAGVPVKPVKKCSRFWGIYS